MVTLDPGVGKKSNFFGTLCTVGQTVNSEADKMM